MNQPINHHIKYRQLKAFVLVARHASFKLAAEALSVTQSSLSALIKELESDVGSGLFVRTTRSCRLTEAGEAFLQEIRDPLDRLEDAYRHAREVGAGNLGKLGIAALSSLCSGVLVQELAPFQKRFPGVRISLIESNHRGVVEAVRRGDVELGIGSLPLADPELLFEPLFADRLSLVAPKGHPSTKGDPDWASLGEFELVLMRAGFAEKALQAMSSKQRPDFEVEQAPTALAMVRHGMGITVLPSSIVSNLNMTGMACKPIRGPLALRTLGLLRRANSRPSTPARLFAEQLRQSKLLAQMKAQSAETRP